MQEQGQRQGRTRGMTAHARFMCDVVHDWARARGDWRAGSGGDRVLQYHARRASALEGVASECACGFCGSCCWAGYRVSCFLNFS